MLRSSVFPFCAVLGQDKVKKALLLNVINPSIGGVLICGEKGTAKSTLVRGLAAVLRDTEVVELPLNITEDRLVGTIDIEKAVGEGKRCFEAGILHRADGNILYVDEVNLLSEHIANCLLEAAASGVSHVEREGISCTHSSRFVLVGTMNPEEGALRPQLLDRFGLYVEVCGSRQLSERKEIIRRRLEYEKGPLEYFSRWEAEARALSDHISRAQKKLQGVKVSDNILTLASEMAMEGNCAGHRAELVIIESAKAMAAFDNRGYVTVEDIKQAAELALPHRIREMPPRIAEDPPEEADSGPDREEPELESSGDEAGKEEENSQDGTDNEAGDMKEEKPPEQEPGEEKAADAAGPEGPAQQGGGQGAAGEESVEEPGEIFEIRPLVIEAAERKKRKGSGKRVRTHTGAHQGRYVRYTFPKGKLKDLAFDATLRAAAPYQRTREREGTAVVIRSTDFREKVREKRTGSTILFIVDASGSMGVRQRMKAVKGAILSILNDAYQKRDKVGMIAFRKDSAQLLLGITRSVELAQKSLRELPTGGKTPLAGGLYRGYELLKAAKLRDLEMIPLLVLVSDGRANVGLGGADPVEDAVKMAGLIASEGIKSLVIDTEKDFIRLGLAGKIARAMNAQYCRLEELEQKGIELAVRNMV